VQFTGREQDSTGLYYYRARYYNPVLQRFIAEDPLGFGGSDVNLHAYTFNNPTNFTDPGGQQVRVNLPPGSLPACERYYEIGQRKPPSFWDWLWCQVELAGMLPFPGAMASSPSRLLGRNMMAAGAARPAGAAAHHIAAESARLAERARRILARFNIDINGSANGIFLDAAEHAKIHAKAYYEAVNEMLGRARTRAEALQILDRIRALIAAGNFPPK
jgi:RHS repeat-associated protein